MEERSNDGWWQRKWWWWIRHSSMCKIRWNWRRWSEFQRQGNAYWNEWKTCDFQTKVGWWLSNLNEEQVIQVSPMSGCDCESSVNNSVVCLGWCRMTCAGWLFLSECSTSLLWQSIVVFGTELQGIRLLFVSFWSCWSPAPAICQMSSTVSSASLPQHLWDSYTFHRRTKSLEFTVCSSVGSSCWPRTI